MKSLFISLLILTLAQTTFAAPVLVDLDEADSKKMYNILATWGARQNDSLYKRTNEWVTSVFCGKDSVGNYACRLHDELHNTDPAIAGPMAIPLYNMVGSIDGILCSISSGNCSTFANSIKCVRYWNPKHNDLRRKYLCRIENPPSVN